jgi:hypothetical protein
VGQPFPNNEQSLSTTFRLIVNLRINAPVPRRGGHERYDGNEAFAALYGDRPFPGQHRGIGAGTAGRRPRSVFSLKELAEPAPRAGTLLGTEG